MHNTTRASRKKEDSFKKRRTNTVYSCEVRQIEQRNNIYFYFLHMN